MSNHDTNNDFYGRDLCVLNACSARAMVSIKSFMLRVTRSNHLISSISVLKINVVKFLFVICKLCIEDETDFSSVHIDVSCVETDVFNMEKLRVCDVYPVTCFLEDFALYLFY